MVKYRIKLTADEVSELSSITKKGSHSTLSYRAALVLLNCDEGEHSLGKSTHKEISNVLKINDRTIERIKQRFVEGGLECALERAESSRIYNKKVDGDLEAKIVQICCSDPPDGHARWTVRLVTEKVIELEYVDYISHVSVHNTLKKGGVAKNLIYLFHAKPQSRKERNFAPKNFASLRLCEII